MFMDSVLMMMNHYGQGVIKDIFNLCNKILEDEYLTSCATMVGDETEGTGENMSITCYGFATLVNLSKYHNERFAKEILAFLKEKYGKAHASTYEQVAATKQKGLFIREKYYNLPDEVADTLLRQLKKDYRWVEEYEEDFEEDQYRFEKIICVLR
jgi:dihydroneopterin aldolase